MKNEKWKLRGKKLIEINKNNDTNIHKIKKMKAKVTKTKKNHEK